MGKRLCLISPKFSSHVGGMETHAYEFARAFATDAEYPLAAVLTRAVVPDGIPAPAQGSGTSRIEGSTRSLESLVSRELTGDFAQDAETILRRCDVDDTIFYLNNSTWLPTVALLKERHPRARVVLRSGGNDLVAGWIGDETDMSQPLEASRARVVAMIDRAVDTVIVNSAFSYRRALALGVPAEKMVTIVGGVDCRSFGPREGPPSAGTVRILSVARLVPFKGFAYALAAIRALCERGITNIQYTVVGDGPERPALERSIEGPLAEHVRLVGARHFADIPACMREADIFLHMPLLLCRRERGGPTSTRRRWADPSAKPRHRGCRSWRRGSVASQRSWKMARRASSSPRGTPTRQPPGCSI